MPTYPFRSYEMSERRKFQQRMADSISNGVTNSTSSPTKSSMVPRFRPGTSTEETLCSKTHSDSSKCSHPPSAIPLDSRNKTTVSSSTFPTRRAIKTTWDPYPPRNNKIPMHVRRTSLRIQMVVSRTRSREIFDSLAEFLAYCESEVLLLKDACQCQ